jgi:hypothetical protein
MALTDPQPHARRITTIVMTVDGTDFSTQLQTGVFDPGVTAGDQQFTLSSAGEGHNAFYEDTDPKATLAVKGFEDWRSGGLSDFIYSNINAVVDFVFEQNPDIPAEHILVTGSLKIIPHATGGDARTYAMVDCTWPVLPGYAYDHPGS